MKTRLHTAKSDVKLTFHSDDHDFLATAANVLHVTQEANGWIRFNPTTKYTIYRVCRGHSGGDAMIPGDYHYTTVTTATGKIHAWFTLFVK